MERINHGTHPLSWIVSGGDTRNIDDNPLVQLVTTIVIFPLAWATHHLLLTLGSKYLDNIRSSHPIELTDFAVIACIHGSALAVAFFLAWTIKLIIGKSALEFFATPVVDDALLAFLFIPIATLIHRPLVRRLRKGWQSSGSPVWRELNIGILGHKTTTVRYKNGSMRDSYSSTESENFGLKQDDS